MELELAGRTALVTGASGDIGAACARALAREGVRVQATGRSRGRLEALAAAAREAGHAIEPVAGDLTDERFVHTLVTGPPPDILVHAAGHRFTYARFHCASAEDLALTQKIEVDAFARLCAWVLPEMMGRRFGRVVAITSLAAHSAAAGSASYGSAKAALEGLVRGIAVEYGRFRITANAVAPGFVATSRFEARATEENRTRFAQATSVKRIAQPEEIAAPVTFLCSAAASYITGVTLRVAGGADLNNLW